MKKIVRENLDEIFVGKYNVWEDTIELYKNPSSIKRMVDGTRGISDKNGDLYVADSYCIHGDIFDAMKQYREIKEITNLDVYSNLNDYGLIFWQRVEKTNKFKLGESYGSYYFKGGDYKRKLKKEKFKDIEKIYNKLVKKNPQFSFVLESINSEYEY
jgi:hypothetical protein